MLKACGPVGATACITLGINSFLYTVLLLRFSKLFISLIFTSLFTNTNRAVMNIKVSLNQSIYRYLSTVSTAPTIKATKLKFNEIIIIKQWSHRS